MLLYHGTTKSVADKALKSGLKPRGTRRSMWDQKSDPNSVYLTNAYAPYFSVAACGVKNETFGAVLQIDTDKIKTNFLSQALFFADEDACEQATRKSFPEDWNMNRRTDFWRDNPLVANKNGLDWKWSLDVLGTCRYNEIIPSEAITKVAIWNEKEYPMVFIFDPTITLINYQIMGSRYRRLTQMFMQEPETEEIQEIDKMLESQEQGIRDYFKNVKVTDYASGS